MFKLSLEEGIVPSDWKEPNITPLFKKGSRNKPENYRPVSLTSVICKLLETLIRDHMVEFLGEKKINKYISTSAPKSNKLVKWSEKWQMLLNFGKCNCTHIGHGYIDEVYTMGDAVLGRTTQEKDSGRALWDYCCERK